MDDKQTAIERLEQLLNEKDEELARFNEAEEYEKDEAAWSWTQHRERKGDDGLPLPRLEIRCEPLDDKRYNWTWYYSLIYRHFLGEIIEVPMGQTRCNGRFPKDPFQDMPFRESAHIYHDMNELGLPAYSVIGENRVKLEGTPADRSYSLPPEDKARGKTSANTRR